MTQFAATTFSSGDVSLTIGAGTTVSTISSNPTDNGVYIGSGVTTAQIINSGTIFGYVGVNAQANHVNVTNNAGGLIASGNYTGHTLSQTGVILDGSTSTLINAGTVSGYSEGVYLGGANDVVTNQSGGVIYASGYTAIWAHGGTNATLVNAGTVGINAELHDAGAVGFYHGGAVTNLATGTISGNGGTYGVKIEGGAGTVLNAGTIDSGLTLASGYANRLIIDPGAVFSGPVIGGGTAALELGSGSGTGTVNLTGSVYTGFNALTLDAGASWLIEADSSLASTFGTIDGFGATDTIQLPGSDAISSQTASSGETHVTLTGPGAMTLTFDGIESFQVTNLGTVTDLTEVAGPTLTTGGTVTFTGAGAGVVVDATASITDTNNVTSATIAIGTGFTAGDTLTYTSQSGITGSFNTNTGTLVLTGDASAAAFQSVLDSVTFNFSPTDGDPTQAGNDTSRTIDWQVADASGASSVTSSTVDTQESSVLNYGDTIDETGLVATSETVTVGVITLFNSGDTAVGVIVVGNSLTTGDFILAPDGSGGTDVIEDAVFGTYTNGLTLRVDPTTITAIGTVTNAAQFHPAVGGPYGTGWTLTNYGLISETGSGSYGVSLGSAGTVINAGSIYGSQFSVLLASGGLAYNRSGGTITGFYGVVAEGAATVVNAGLIAGSDSTVNAAGVFLDAGGSVTNQSGGTISGYSFGVNISNAAGTVVNAGRIIAGNGTDGVYLAQGGSITNQSGGTITGPKGVYADNGVATVVNAGGIYGAFGGVYLNGSGSVINQFGGSITGQFSGVYARTGTVINAGYIGGTRAVKIGHPGTVINQAGGTISGGTDAVDLSAGYTNLVVVDPGAVFIGEVDGGNAIGSASISTLELASSASAGTLSGLATQYVDFAQVTVDTGADWVFSGANTLLSGATLTNSGTLTDTGALTNGGLITGASQAIQLGAGALITNQSGGVIEATGTDAIAILGSGAGTVVNAGQIIGGTTGVSSAGIRLAAAGSITNQSGGTITGFDGIYASAASTSILNLGDIASDATHGSGIVLSAGGTVTNEAGASITGTTGIIALDAAATIVNAGYIADSQGGIAVDLRDGGAVTNQSGGTLIGRTGVYGYGGVSVVNAGLIVGTAFGGEGVYLGHGGTITNQSGGTISGVAYAVTFASGYTNRLVIDPGATFSGTVGGGNTIGASSISTLELASGASVGTLNGLGSQYIDFAQVTFDAGAQWDLVGSDATTALAGATISGFALGDTIDVTNFAATGESFSGNELTLTSGSGTISLDIVGSFSTSQFQLRSDGADGTDIVLTSALSYGDTIDEAGIVASSETVNAGGTLTLFNAGGAPVGTIGVGTSLSSGDFTLRSDGSGGTDVIISTIFGTYTSGVTLDVLNTTIAPTASVTGSVADAVGVFGPSGTAWTLTNLVQRFHETSQLRGIPFMPLDVVGRDRFCAMGGDHGRASEGVGDFDW